ncbi:MAG: LacI family transcriptional regulator [Candidatus Thermofonsia Clade 1 bacterium]|jgi:DNA-binding LacI/PurR family transcriptional regulator|uniref:LacI family transcriptional regulator n=1 Tax=Candidatus Thermofonsia Clade 1 bacterium TaxID=2364210 RepID=A0A2M8PGT8_9CHLR|nr:MAG: LacI family transcriptional regulator [Candidatus Thermofonsia Clade 1 bacterium]RMF50025.1 MAG: LacI family DNA-binding transcriptional regulator [Chloroflexota bacterium]
MATLREVAALAKVPLLTAYHALSGTQAVPEAQRQSVLAAAEQLGYTLNITIKDVATLANVSIATVSYVLNDSAPVSAATRHRVLEAAAALNYRPNVNGRTLQANKTRLVGYGWHNVKRGHSAPLLDRFTYWMAQAVESYGYHVLTFAHSEESPTDAYEELIQTNRVDGFILAHTNRNDARIRYLMQMRVPFAAFGRANDRWDFPYVDVDGRRGIELVTEHLIGLGHTRIALIGWPEGSLSGDARVQGYFDALDAAAITPQPAWIRRTENSSSAAAAAAAELLVLPSEQRPTAIVCVSDLMAIGVMNYLNRCGIQVGYDVAVSGFDDDPITELLHPPLTTLRQPVDDLAAQVVALLMAELERTPLPQRQILVAPQLIVRASTDPRVNSHSILPA